MLFFGCQYFGLFGRYLQSKFIVLKMRALQIISTLSCVPMGVSLRHGEKFREITPPVPKLFALIH